MLEDLIKQLREIKKNGIAFKEVAKRAGLSMKTIRRWCKGNHKPHPLHWKAFEEAVEDIISFYKERGIIIEKII